MRASLWLTTAGLAHKCSCRYHNNPLGDLHGGCQGLIAELVSARMVAAAACQTSSFHPPPASSVAASTSTSASALGTSASAPGTAAILPEPCLRSIQLSFLRPGHGTVEVAAELDTEGCDRRGAAVDGGCGGGGGGGGGRGRSGEGASSRGALVNTKVLLTDAKGRAISRARLGWQL
jgi:hypothetical protein